MSKNTVIVDYRLGNIFSVKQACEKTGIQSLVSFNKRDLIEADALILPGVGAFGEAMNHLKDLDLIDAIKEHVQKGKPLFGICLGLQLLFTESEEFGVANGLGIIPGCVKKIKNVHEGELRLVPQVGWNQVEENGKNWENTPLCTTSSQEYFYFVHSYYVAPSNSKNIIGETDYDGLKYCSVAFSDEGNVFATQFHPEKSGIKGLEIYTNWAKQHKLI